MLLHLWHSIGATPRLREHFRPLWGLVSEKAGHCCCASSRACWAPSTPRGTWNKYDLWSERGRAEAMHTRLLETEDKARTSLCGVCFTYESGLCEREQNLAFLLLLFRNREKEWAAVRWCHVKKNRSGLGRTRSCWCFSRARADQHTFLVFLLTTSQLSILIWDWRVWSQY